MHFNSITIILAVVVFNASFLDASQRNSNDNQSSGINNQLLLFDSEAVNSGDNGRNWNDYDYQLDVVGDSDNEVRWKFKRETDEINEINESYVDEGYFPIYRYPNKTVYTDLPEEEFEAWLISQVVLPVHWALLLIIINIIVFIVGLVGNTLVCVAVYKNHTMRTVTNYFIVNLAVADFLVILFCLPPSVAWDVAMTWFFGVAMCKIVMYLQNVSVVVSVLTLTFISIDRWYAICFPLKFKSTTGRAKTAIAMIWIFALLVDIPEFIYLEITKYELPYDLIYTSQCSVTWSRETDKTYYIVKVLLLYLTPLLFMSVAYYHIIRVLWKSGNQHAVDVGGNRQTYTFTMVTNTSTRGQLRSRKKAAKMLVAVVIMFALCYFPVHLLSLLRVTTHIQNTDENRAFALFSHWLCYANSAANPIIYNFMSGKFRKEFRRVFSCCSSSSSSSSNTRSSCRELNSMYYKNIGKDSSLGSQSPARITKRQTQVEIRRTDTVVTDLRN